MATTTPNYELKKPDATDPFGDFRTDYNNNMDIIDANLGGGGGDSVSWNQIQASGTKIAEIDINGVTKDVYAPSGGGGGALNYSLTEQVVGTWINSKPVYQKTFYSTSALSAYVAITHGIANLGLVIKTECVIRASNLSNQIPILTDQYNAEVVITPTKIEIYLNNDFVSVCNGGYIVTLQYTKTTD